LSSRYTVCPKYDYEVRKGRRNTGVTPAHNGVTMYARFDLKDPPVRLSLRGISGGYS